MKKFFSVVMMLLTFSSNFFYFSFADETLKIDGFPGENIQDTSIGAIENIPDEFTGNNETQPEIVETNNDLADISFGVGNPIIEDFDLGEQIENEYLCGDCPDIIDDCDNEDDFCRFCFLECDDGGTESWGDFDDDSGEDERGDDGRGEEDEEIVLPNLIISEVFFDGTKEWIEIYNAGDNFTGDIDLVVNSKYTTLENFYIGAGETKVIANNSVDFITNICFDTFEKNISITDTKEISISIEYEYETIDSFYVSATDVKQADKKKNISFHRFMDTKEIVESLEYGIFLQ